MGLMQGIARTFRASNSARLSSLARQLRQEAERDGVIPLPKPARQRAAYDRLIDALNRLPRPAMAIGTLVLLATAMVAPDWFANRMEALSQMPEALWWVIGAVISLFFGARFQSVDQAFQRELATNLWTEAPPLANALTPGAAATGTDAGATLLVEVPTINLALAAHQAGTKT
jgi:hypothetical protein